MDSLLRGIARCVLSSGDERHYSLTHHHLPPGLPKKVPHSLLLVSLLFMTHYVSFPSLYPNKSDLLEIIGSNNHSFSVTFQTVCL